MITKLIIRRFQTHTYRVLELDRVNTIVGTNDRGKSAILRALRWLATNKPRGSDFVQHGAPNTSVTAIVDGHRITRIKGKDDNVYVLDGKELGAVGTEVPRDVADVLHLDEAINFQGQHDAPFWFGESSAEVSRRLNEVVDLSVIDTTLANLATAQRRAKTEREVTADRLTAARANRDALAYVLDAKEDLDRLAAMDERHGRVKQKHDDLCNLIDQAQEIEGLLQSHRGVLKDAQRVIAIGESWDEVSQRVQVLEELIQNAQDFREIASIELPDLSELESLEAKAIRADRRLGTIQALVNQALDLSDTIHDLRKRKRKAEERLRTEMGDTCVLCGQAIR